MNEDIKKLAKYIAGKIEESKLEIKEHIDETMELVERTNQINDEFEEEDETEEEKDLEEETNDIFEEEAEKGDYKGTRNVDSELPKETVKKKKKGFFGKKKDA